MLHTYDRVLAKVTFESAPEQYYTLLCCGLTVSETDFLEYKNSEYYQNEKGDIWCADCIRSAFNFSTGLKYVIENNLKEDFKDYLTAECVFNLVDACGGNAYFKCAESMIKDFCFDDFDSYAQWFVNYEE